MRFSLSYRPKFTLDLPFGTLGVELPLDDCLPVRRGVAAEACFERTQELADEITSAISAQSVALALDRMLVLADEFAPEDRRSAILLSNRFAVLDKTRPGLPETLWREKLTELVGDTLDVLAEYQSKAALGMDETGELSRKHTGDAAATDQPDMEPTGVSTTTVSSADCLVRCGDLGWGAADKWPLRHVTLDIHPGSVVAVVGRNGAGKTTLLRLLAKSLKPTEGTVSYPSLEERGYSPWRIQERLYYVPATPRSRAGTLERNLRLFAALRGFRHEALENEVAYVIERFQLNAYRTMRWATLSGGYKTRAELAVAVLASPQLLILDEPLGPLDVQAQREYLRSLRDLADSRRRACIVVTSQDVHAVDAIADQVIALDTGRILFSGIREELRGSAPQSVFEFIVDVLPEDLEQAFSRFPRGELAQHGIITTFAAASSVTARDVITTLVGSGVRVRYFRDLTGSAQRLIETHGVVDAK